MTLCVFIHLGIAPLNWLLSQLVTIFSLELVKGSILTRVARKLSGEEVKNQFTYVLKNIFK